MCKLYNAYVTDSENRVILRSGEPTFVFEYWGELGGEECAREGASPAD